MFQERKEEYLQILQNSIDVSEGQYKATRSMLNKVAGHEDIFDADLCEFNITQLAALFSDLGWFNASTFNEYKVMINKYTNWCIANGHCSTNYVKDFSMRHLVDNSIMNSYYRDVDSFLNTITEIYDIEELDNAEERFLMHKALWCLAWIGFKKEEASAMLKSDIREDSVVTETYSAKNVDPRIMKILNECKELSTIPFSYESQDGICKTTHRTLVDTPYLFRPTKGRNTGTGMIGKSTFNTWAFNANALRKKYMSVLNPATRKELQYSKIYKCGMYSRLHQWEVLNDGDATLYNASQWCALVRQGEDVAFKNTLPAFLKGYNTWKRAFYN